MTKLAQWIEDIIFLKIYKMSKVVHFKIQTHIMPAMKKKKNLLHPLQIKIHVRFRECLNRKQRSSDSFSILNFSYGEREKGKMGSGRRNTQFDTPVQTLHLNSPSPLPD